MDSSLPPPQAAHASPPPDVQRVSGQSTIDLVGCRTITASVRGQNRLRAWFIDGVGFLFVSAQSKEFRDHARWQSCVSEALTRLSVDHGRHVVIVGRRHDGRRVMFRGNAIPMPPKASRKAEVSR